MADDFRSGVRTGPLQAGERVILTDPKGRMHTITLAEGKQFHTHRGFLRHDDLIGAPDGSTITNTAGTDLSISLVAPAPYEIYCTVDIAGSSTPTIACTMKKADNTTEIKSKALDDTLDATEAIDLATDSDVYIGCTLITVTGGGASGTVQIRSKKLRTPVI